MAKVPCLNPNCPTVRKEHESGTAAEARCKRAVAARLDGSSSSTAKGDLGKKSFVAKSDPKMSDEERLSDPDRATDAALKSLSRGSFPEYNLPGENGVTRHYVVLADSSGREYDGEGHYLSGGIVDSQGRKIMAGHTGSLNYKFKAPDGKTYTSNFEMCEMNDEGEINPIGAERVSQLSTDEIKTFCQVADRTPDFDTSESRDPRQRIKDVLTGLRDNGTSVSGMRVTDVRKDGVEYTKTNDDGSEEKFTVPVQTEKTSSVRGWIRKNLGV